MTIKKSKILYKISEYEAEIGVYEMIIEDYKDIDPKFAKVLQLQINEWNTKILKLKQSLNK